MQNHGSVAVEIGSAIHARTVEVVECRSCGRQGDIILSRIGDSEGRGEPVAAEGRCIAAGNHGEHRLLAGSALVSGDGDSMVLDLPQGGVLVHTDVPAARHAPMRLAPGRWQVEREQEVDLAGSIVKVQD